MYVELLRDPKTHEILGRSIISFGVIRRVKDGWHQIHNNKVIAELAHDEIVEENGLEYASRKALNASI